MESEKIKVHLYSLEDTNRDVVPWEPLRTEFFATRSAAATAPGIDRPHFARAGPMFPFLPPGHPLGPLCCLPFGWWRAGAR